MLSSSDRVSSETKARVRALAKRDGICTGTGSAPTNCTTTPGYSESETYDTYARLSQRSMTLPGEYGGSFA